MKKIVRSVLMASFAAVLVFGMSGAGEAQAAQKGKVKSVTISAPVKVKSGKTGKYTIYQVPGKKASKTLKAKCSVKGKASKVVYYKTSNKAVVTVNKKTGKMTTSGKKTGNATITAYAKANTKIRAKLKVTVKNFKPSMKVNGLENVVYFTKGTAVKGSVSVSGTGLKSVSYSSDNKNVLTVDGKGNVVVKGAGAATISAKAVSKTGASVVLKKKITVKAFSPKMAEKELMLNMKTNTTTSFITQDVKNGSLAVTGEGLKSVTYKSSNPAVAVVDAQGKVTAVGGGTAKVTAEAVSKNGGKATLSAYVYVRNETKIQTPSSLRDYENFYFDYSNAINNGKVTYKSVDFTTPTQKRTAGITVSDANGATGVQLVKGKNSKTDFYLNTFVANSTLEIQVSSKAKVEVTSTKADGSTADVNYDKDTKKYQVVLEPLAVNPTGFDADKKAPIYKEQTIQVKIDSQIYTIHTRNEMLPDLKTYVNKNEAITEANKGVYSFALDRFMIRVNTEQEIVYYRDLNCICEHSGEELMAENFRAVDAREDGQRYYTFFLELDNTKRNMNGGFSSGMYVILDKNYQEIDYVTLQPNKNKNHKHGEGYLDQHEFQLYSRDHWVLLSYTEHFVTNIPECVPTKDGSGTGYVHAGIIQEVKDGKVVQEINTTDYPVLYETAMETTDYVHSTDKGMTLPSAADPTQMVFSLADGYMDYVHVNSVDIDPADGNFVVSMRHQYSVFKFDRKTGEIIWTLSGLNDDFGLKPDEKFIGQHYAYYEKEDVAGNTSTLTVFDNHTNFGKNFTRMAEITFNGAENAVEKKTYYNGSDLDALSKELGVPDLNLIHEGIQHWATHCGSVEKQAADSMVMGWGLHGKYSNISFTSTVPVFTEYNPQTKKLTFELYATRNPQMQSHEGFFSYRTYKNKN